MNRISKHIRSIQIGVSILLLFSNWSIAQNRNSIKFWDLESISGSVFLESFYRTQETLLKSNSNEYQKSSVIAGQLSLNTKSYLLHPNFFQMDFNVEYRPGLQKDNFLVIPDRSETRTMEKVNFHSTFFQGKPLSLNFFTNYTHNFINREYTSNVEVNHNNIGAALFFRNYIVPVNISFSKDDWKQNEIQSGRKFSTLKYLVNVNLQKSFGNFNRNKLKYSYEDNQRNDISSNSILSKISTIDLKNNFYFNKEHTSTLNSFITFDSRTGDRKTDRLQINENFMMDLPYQFNFATNYRNMNYKQEDLDYIQNNVTATLNHKLYSSIQTSLQYEYNDLNHSSYHEFYSINGLSVNYKKNIPSGTLSLFYDYNNRKENRNSSPEVLSIVDEKLQLDDLKTVLLKNPFVLINSIVVTDLNKTIIYEENIDYIIIAQANFIEIQRLPGGQIQNGDYVLLEYSTEKQLSYSFNSTKNAYGIHLNLFKNSLELYARSNSQEFKDIDVFENKIFKNIDQRVIGAKISYKFITAGYEYNIYDSNIIPYNSTKYYLNFSKTANKIKFILSGKRREHILKETNENQFFSDIAGKVIYQFNPKYKIKLDGGYRIQEGRQIDLNLFTARGEFVTSFRKMFFTVGFEMYNRNFSGEKINFNSAYLKIERFF